MRCKVMTIGERIKRLRIQRGVNQADLAKVLSVSPSAIGMYEQNRRGLDANSLLLLANYFDVTVDYLLGNKTQKEPTATMDSELEEDVVIFHRDGKNQQRKLTKEQMDMLIGMLNAIPEKPKDL